VEAAEVAGEEEAPTVKGVRSSGGGKHKHWMGPAVDTDSPVDGVGLKAVEVDDHSYVRKIFFINKAIF
jgi:hypothetical protein